MPGVFFLTFFMQEVIYLKTFVSPQWLTFIAVCFYTEKLCSVLRLIMRNPDVLLGCQWMSSAVHDTAAGFSAQTGKQRLRARLSDPSPCRPSIHLSALSPSFIPLHFYFYTFFCASSPPSLSPTSFPVCYHVVCSGRRSCSQQSHR